jgi:hypothetical protein
MKQISARARVQITIEVDAGVWGEDCAISQLHKQAAESGLANVQNALAKSQVQHAIIGEPRVVGVLTEREK